MRTHAQPPRRPATSTLTDCQDCKVVATCTTATCICLALSIYCPHLLEATTALAACCGFDLCHKYILYLYLYLYFGWDATYFLLYTIALRCVASPYFAFLLYRGCMLFVMFFGPFRYFYFRVRVRLLTYFLLWHGLRAAHISRNITDFLRKLNFCC